MDNILEIIALIVTITGGMKAVGWIFDKIFTQRDKGKQIDTNKEELEKFKAETEERFQKLEKSVSDAHNFAQKNLDSIKKEIVDTITDHRNEYLQGIKEVKESITEMSGLYQQTVAIIDLKIEQLSANVEKHNQVVERTYSIEKSIGILENRESVSEHRIDDLEKKTGA